MSNINVLVELERCGVTYGWSSEDFIKVECPWHDDKSPSASIAVEDGRFTCHAASCLHKDDLVGFLAKKLKTSRKVVFLDLSSRYPLDADRSISPNTIEQYHARIWQAKPLLKALRERAVDEDLVRKHRLGENDGRITIPIRNAAGTFVNVLKYLPGAPGVKKMKNAKGRARLRLFPIEQLAYERIVLCGGPIKAIAAGGVLNRIGVGAVSSTGGEGHWDPTLTEALIGKDIWIMMDIDEAGQNAAQLLANAIFSKVRSVRIIELPLDIGLYPHGDVNDFLGKEHGDLPPLLDKAEVWRPRQRTEDVDDTPIETSLQGATDAKLAGKRVRFDAVVTSMDTSPFVIPCAIKAHCDRNQKECPVCAVYPMGQDPDISLHPESQGILEMVNAPRSKQREAIMSTIGVPRTCKSFDHEVVDYMNAEDVRLTGDLNVASKHSDRVLQPAIAIGQGLEANEPYKMEGRLYPHPLTGQAVLLVSKYEATQDALTSYIPESTSHLQIFQPKEWTLAGLKEKLNDVYADFESNITRIYERRDLHLAIDLAYHSVLNLTFDERVERGKLEVLIVGDSSQGKTETATHLQRHYNLGEMVESKNASVAGLLGGLIQTGKRWMLDWGAIPRHDRRLVILEELKGMSPEAIAKLTSMRSTGVAEITKIEKRKTHARTRLIMLSNPRGEATMGSYSYGVQAVLELMGAYEDVRRLDFALTVSQDEVSADRYNQYRSNGSKTPHKYTQELSRELVLWAWTREPQHTQFDESLSKLVLDTANELSKRYSDKIPLLDRGSARHKVAKMAAALACRTFSTDDGINVVVRPCHVEFIAEYVERCYSKPSCGYRQFSESVLSSHRIADPDKVEHALRNTPFPKDFVDSILYTEIVEISDILDWTGWDRVEAMQLVSFMVRKRCLVRDGRGYRKTTSFNELLRSMQQAGDLDDRPDFIPEEF